MEKRSKIKKLVVLAVFLVLLTPQLANATTNSDNSESESLTSTDSRTKDVEGTSVDSTNSIDSSTETSTSNETSTTSTVSQEESSANAVKEQSSNGHDIKTTETNNDKNNDKNEEEYNKFVTITSETSPIYSSDFSFKVVMEAKDAFGKTFQSKKKIKDDNGVTYLLLFDGQNKEIGLIDETATTLGSGREGVYQSYGKYVTITNSYYTTYNNFSWDERSTTKDINGKTFQARGRYQHINGMTYLSLFDDNGNWYGYVNEQAVSVADGREGIYQSYGKYVTITNDGYTTYNSFSWNERGTTKNMYLKTYQARGKYQHANGMTYLSLYDNNGNWYGYVNEKAAKVGGGREGAYQSYGKYVTVTNGWYTTYNNFTWNERGTTKAMNGKTYEARGKYQHINGITYLSLFDGQGNWYGYVNEAAVTTADGRQGIYQDYGKYVTIMNDGYTTYNNFSWNVRNSTKDKYKKTYLARGKYQHINGSTYLSLFDSNGGWYGYVNENATQVAEGRQGIFQRLDKYVIIKSRNYDMYRSFNWDVKQKSSAVYNKGLVAAGEYRHMNGSTYYSIYNGSGQWQGYINKNAVDIVTYKVNYAPYYSQMSIGAFNGCAATALYTAFQAKGYATNVSLIDFINGLPLSNSNPDEGQIGNTWGTTPFREVISPVGLTKYARQYTTNTEILTGGSIDTVINEINSGNQVLYWGIYLMRDPSIKEKPQHVMIARGYKVENGKEYILIQDSGLYSSSSPYAVRWYEKNAFNSYLTNKQRKMMVVR